MWIASKFGWFSIVKKTDGWHVRARVRQDLENLIRAGDICKRWTIIETPDADYRYRFIVGKVGINRVFDALERSVDYPNFKAEIAALPDQRHKLRAYHEIWEKMAALQTSDATTEQEYSNGFPCGFCGARTFEESGDLCRGAFDCPGDSMSKEVFR